MTPEQLALIADMEAGALIMGAERLIIKAPDVLTLIAIIREQEAALNHACADVRFAAGKAMVHARDGMIDGEAEARLLRIANRIAAALRAQPPETAHAPR